MAVLLPFRKPTWSNKKDTTTIMASTIAPSPPLLPSLSIHRPQKQSQQPQQPPLLPSSSTSSSSSSSSSGPLTSFPLFSRLPPELRLQIWELALPLTHSGRGVCVLTPEAMPLGTRTHDPLVVHDPPTALHRTCRESRAVALAAARHQHHVRPYDPATDLLYVGRRNFVAFASAMCSPVRTSSSSSSSSLQHSSLLLSPLTAGSGNSAVTMMSPVTAPSVLLPPLAWTAEVRHLAVGVAVTEHETHLGLAMQQLPWLESLAVVVPRAAGTVDVQADVVVPCKAATGATGVDGGTTRRRLALRRLTGPELRRLRVSADYIYDTWAGGCPVKWSRTGAEHLDLWRRSLEYQANSNCVPVEKPPCWDVAEKRLRLEFEARCFE